MPAHLEEVIEQTGGCGRYQVCLVVFLHFGKIIMTYSMLFMVFGGKVPHWWCADDAIGHNATSSEITSFGENTSSKAYKSCFNLNGTTCKNFVFDESIRTIISEWSLVCDEEWVSATITSIQMAGVFAGNAVSGRIADLIGRKPPFYIAVSTMTALTFLIVFSNSWIMFAVMRFFIGLATGFQLTIQYNFMCEFVLVRYRTWVVSVPSWEIATILFAVVASQLQDWRYINVVFGITGVIFMASFCFVPESFRWLMAHDRIKDADKVVHFVAKVNRSPAPGYQTLKDIANDLLKIAENDGDRKYSMLDLWKSRQLMKLTLLLTPVWISFALGYYGMQFGMQALSGSLYVNMCIFATIISFVQMVSIYMINRLGRRKVGLILYSMFAVAAAIVGVLSLLKASDTSREVSRVFAIVSLVCVSVVCKALQTLTIEVYPSVVRNIGYGFQNTMGRVGSILSPQLALLDSKFPGSMYFVCAGIGIVAVLSLLPLPETKGKPLEDKLPDNRSEVSSKTEDEKRVNV